MKSLSSSNARDFDAAARKTFRHALQSFLEQELPGVFGPTLSQFFASRLEALFHQFHPPAQRLRMGQVLWCAVAADDPPARHKRIENTRTVPVILDLVLPDDLDHLIDGKPWSDLRRERVVRLCRQAYQQGGVLSAADAALLLSASLTVVGRAIQAHEQATSQTVPRRGTIHDLGMALTHKALICRKRLVEKKSVSQVASETCHSPEAVERYVQSLHRVKLCQEKHMTPEEIVQATGYSRRLVQEYLDLIQDLNLPDWSEPDSTLHSDTNLP
jgi:hypothetical protein